MNRKRLGLVVGGHWLDIDRLVADVALLLRIVEVNFDVGGGDGGDRSGWRVGGGGGRVICGGTVDGGLASEGGALLAVDGSVDAVRGSVIGV